MYSKLPNIVIGFHGCSQETLEKIVFGSEQMTASDKPYDWLGHDVYFWEQNYERAWEWAKDNVKRGTYDAPAVIGAVIDLGKCLNLMDSTHIRLLKEEYDLLKFDLEQVGCALPKNRGQTKDKLLRELDCAVIEHLHQRVESDAFHGVAPYDSVRGLFVEGNPIYADSGFHEKTHIQLCVRNPNCIKGCFIPREFDNEWIAP